MIKHGVWYYRNLANQVVKKKKKMPPEFITIARKIADNIADGKYYDTLPSINTLSAELNVCPATVKRVISQLRDWNLVSGEKGRCVRVNWKAVKNPFFHKNVVVLTSISSIQNMFYTKVIENINRKLNEHHICFHMFVTEEQFKECGFIPDCVIVVSQMIGNKLDHVCPKSRIIKLNLPEEGFHSVATDNRLAGYEAVKCLAEEFGHKHIGIMTTQLKYDYGCFCQRYQGAMAYAKEHPEIKLTAFELAENVHDTTVVIPAVEKLMKMDPEISAVFSSLDLYALGVYSYAVQNNLQIPGDLSVIGFDDQNYAKLQTPELSTFLENDENMTECLYRLILDILKSPESEIREITTTAQIILRGSITHHKTPQTKRKGKK